MKFPTPFARWWGLALMLAIMPAMAWSQSKVRVVHLLPGGPAMDCYWNKETTPLESAMNFGDGSKYVVTEITEPAGQGFREVKMTRAGQATTIFTRSYPIVKDSSYTVYLFGVNQPLNISQVILGRHKVVAGTNALGVVRFINGSSDAGKLDISITDAKGNKNTTQQLDYQRFTGYQSYANGVCTVEVSQAGGPVFYRATYNLAANQIITIVPSGRLAVPGEFKLRVVDETNDNTQMPLAQMTPLLENKQSTFRVAHLVPDGPALDFYVDNIFPALGTGLTYRNATDLMTTGDGNHTIKMIAPSLKPGDTTFKTMAMKLSADTIYTLVPIGSMATTTSVVTLARGKTVNVPAGKSLVRILHAGVGAGIVDLKITDANNNKVNRDAINYGTLIPAMELPAGATRIDIASSGGATYISTTGVIPAGKMLTLVLNGRKDTEGELSFTIVDETADAAQMPMATFTYVPQGEAKVRIVHAAPTVPAVDIFVDNVTPAAEANLSPRNATALRSFAPGTHNVKVRLAGAGIDSPVGIESNSLLNADSAYTIYAIGLTQPVALTRAFSLTTPAGKGLVRLLHGAEDAGTVDVKLTDASGASSELTGVAFKAFSEYLPLPIGQLTVELKKDGKVFYRARGSVESGQLATIVANGSVTTGDFKLNVVVDNNDAEQKPLAEMTSLPIQAVYQDRAMVTGMSITPNPAASVATVSYGLLKESEITIRLFDAFGQEVGRFGRAAAAGDQQAVIGTEGLANGFYRVMINAANGQVLASDNLIIAR
ncbi:MAG: DUF4397 domain-containing protein [Chlorobi bacterium]|nr:MAG: cell wall anchor domain-containing protein [Chlorobi bacterium OLB7]MBK8909838.1 DUF4397 domain-containing protein [Chlorobiota bacterium]MBX7215591.1 DUF4397 domain-containing protein [Candidatus Kapabacteria bacterium]